MRQLLQSVIRDVPYNSFGKIYHAEGLQYPERFGGNCVFLTRHLTRGLIRAGLVPQFVTEENCAHRAALCREGKEMYHLDPFLLHQEPIPVSRILREGKPVDFDAYPIVDGNPTKVRVAPQGQHRFSVSLSGFKEGTYQRLRDFEYDIRNTSPMAPEDVRQRRDDSDLAYLRLRTLDPDGGATSLHLYSEGFMTATRLGKETVHQKSGPAFYAVLERVAGQLRTDVARLMTFFYEGQKLYRKRAATARESRGYITPSSSTEARNG